MKLQDVKLAVKIPWPWPQDGKQRTTRLLTLACGHVERRKGSAKMPLKVRCSQCEEQ